MTDTLTYQKQYAVRSYEPRKNGRVSISSICNYLQDIASYHADTLGFGFRDLEKSGHFWVLARLHVTVDRLPGFGESAAVTTWPSGTERLVATRDFLVQDEEGIYGKATTNWVTLNKETHRPDPPSTVLEERLIPERERALTFPTRAVSRLKQGEHELNIGARRSDLDINGHVNNVRYIEFCMEPMPEEWIAAHRCTGLDIQFRSESFAGDQYVCACAKSDNDGDAPTYLHSLTRVGDGKEIVRMRSWWSAE